MPTVAELERLQALVGVLTPLADKQRGELIEASDWNRLVGALIELARAVLAEDRTEVVPDHEHTDQVKPGWLDPRLRAQVLRGPLADPAAEARLALLDRRLGRLTERVDTVASGVDKVRVGVGEVTTRDLAREADLTRFARKVDGLGDARTDVADLRGTLRALEVEVGRAVEVGRRLEVNGQPVDVAGLVDRMAAVEELRARLTSPDGTLLDAATFERKLADLRTGLVTENELDVALDTVRGGLTDADRAAVLEAARVSASEVARVSVAAATGELRGEIAEQLGTVDGRVAGAVATATSGLTDTILGRTRTEIAAAVAAGDQAVRAELSASLDARVSQLEARVGTRVDQLADEVGPRVAAAVAEQVPAALAPLEKRLTATEDGVGAVRQSLADQDSRIGQVATRIEEVRREDAAARAKLSTELNKRIETVEQNTTRRIDVVVADQRAVLQTDLQANVDMLRRDLVQVLGQAAAQAAATEVRLLAAQVRGEIREVVGDELQRVDQDLRAAVDAHVKQSQATLGGLVVDEVRRASAGIEKQVREDLQTIRADLDRSVEERIDKRIGRPNRPPTG